MVDHTFPTDVIKFNTVIDNNTFFFHNDDFEETWESYVSSINQSLLILKNNIENEGLKKELFVDFIRNSENGLHALLTLMGFSKEMFLRLITFVRVYNDDALNKLVNKEAWPPEEFSNEWTITKIEKLIQKEQLFAAGIINLLFEGATISVLRKALPLFEYKKLDINKLDFKTESLIDTIVRYKVKGSYSARKENNPETVIEEILNEFDIPFATGKLEGLRRTMDFIIPNKEKPVIIIESSYVVTTSSGMGDKAKTEMTVAEEITKNYPEALFIGFVDGIGWYVRQGDLERIVSAFNFVYTFDKTELKQFSALLKGLISDGILRVN
jgi:hypothetical protein